MPEVTEIRKNADFIRKLIKDKNILEINILNGRYKKKPFDDYKLIVSKLPLKVFDVKTKGKFMYIVFENDFYLFSTFGLTGGWCYLKNNSKDYDFPGTLDDYTPYLNEIDYYIKNSLAHLNVEFKTSEGSLYYYDMLSFGTLKIVKSIEEVNKKLKTIGPDIMDEKTDFEIFKTQIKKDKNLEKEIGNVLMNQKVISGIGNYLRADVLYISKINPFRKVKNLTDDEIKTIFKNSKVLTWGDYDVKQAKKLGIINSKTKLPSDYDRLFFVYNQETDIKGNKVIKKELYEGSQKRFIYYVPSIQK